MSKKTEIIRGGNPISRYTDQNIHLTKAWKTVMRAETV